MGAGKEQIGQLVKIKIQEWDNAAGRNKYDGSNAPW